MFIDIWLHLAEFNVLKGDHHEVCLIWAWLIWVAAESCQGWRHWKKAHVRDTAFGIGRKWANGVSAADSFFPIVASKPFLLCPLKQNKYTSILCKIVPELLCVNTLNENYFSRRLWGLWLITRLEICNCILIQCLNICILCYPLKKSTSWLPSVYKSV